MVPSAAMPDNALAQNRCNSLPCTVRTSRQKVVQSKSCFSVGNYRAYLIPLAIEHVTLKFTRRVCSRWRGDDLYLKRHLALKRSTSYGLTYRIAAIYFIGNKFQLHSKIREM